MAGIARLSGVCLFLRQTARIGRNDPIYAVFPLWPLPMDPVMEDPQKLRELAAWYREFAEKTENPAIWESRLRMAEDLEHEAALLERRMPALAEVR